MRVLHVGCGGDPLPDLWPGCEEVRLDIDPAHKPDVCASMLNMGEIGAFDAIYTSHALEHLYPHQVPVALGEFRRVLNDGGVAVIVVPDLEDVRPTEDVVYDSEAGPICGLDMYYGKTSLIARSYFMAHHCGFISETLKSALERAGFSGVGVRRLPNHQLMAAAFK